MMRGIGFGSDRPPNVSCHHGKEGADARGDRTRILRLPGYGVYAWEAEEGTGTLTLWIRQTAPEPYYVCGGCSISVRDVHSWTEREIRDLPWGIWQVWLVAPHLFSSPQWGEAG